MKHNYVKTLMRHKIENILIKFQNLIKTPFYTCVCLKTNELPPQFHLVTHITSKPSRERHENFHLTWKNVFPDIVLFLSLYVYTFIAYLGNFPTRMMRASKDFTTFNCFTPVMNKNSESSFRAKTDNLFIEVQKLISKRKDCNWMGEICWTWSIMSGKGNRLKYILQKLFSTFWISHGRTKFKTKELDIISMKFNEFFFLFALFK